MGRTGRFYRKVRAKLVERPTFFSWIVAGKLAASGLPSSKAQVGWISKQGINKILSLTEVPLPAMWLDGTGISAEHIPMHDHDPPSFDQLLQASRYIQTQMNSNGAVLVHCLAGKGRTGSAIAAYLIGSGKMDARAAMEHLRRMRPGSVEHAQEVALYEFEKRLRGASTAP